MLSPALHEKPATALTLPSEAFSLQCLDPSTPSPFRFLCFPSFSPSYSTQDDEGQKATQKEKPGEDDFPYRPTAFQRTRPVEVWPWLASLFLLAFCFCSQLLFKNFVDRFCRRRCTSGGEKNLKAISFPRNFHFPLYLLPSKKCEIPTSDEKFFVPVRKKAGTEFVSARLPFFFLSISITGKPEIMPCEEKNM